MKTIKEIDCLLIGPDDLSFSKYEKLMRHSGKDQPAYRDLYLKTLKVENKIYSSNELLEKLCKDKYLNNNQHPNFNTKLILNHAVATLGSYLFDNKMTFDYISSISSQKEEFIGKLTNNKIHTVAIVTTSYVTILPIKQIISLIKKYNKNVKIIVGGPFVWYLIRQQSQSEIQNTFRTLGADIFVDSSEGEKTLVKLIKNIKGGRDLKLIDNIYYKSDSTSTYIKNPNKPENNILNDNEVHWNLFSKTSQAFMYFRTSISCHYRCSFCDFPVRVPDYQEMDIEYIEKQLDTIESMGKVKCIRFIDDTFNIPLKRFREILELLIQKNYSFGWTSFLRCQYIDEDTIRLMKQAKCKAVHVGIESGDSTVLKNMNKKSTVEDYARGFGYLNKYEIPSFATFIIGFPGETRETINNTINFINKHKPSFSLIWPWFCSPLTPIWYDRKKYGLKDWGTNWQHNTMNAHEAADIIEEIVAKDLIKESVFCSLLPELISFFMEYGFTLEQIENYCRYFNEGVKDKLLNQGNDNLSEIIHSKIKMSLA